jgi:transposase-like protein
MLFTAGQGDTLLIATFPQKKPMTRARFSEEFKEGAVKQVIERRYTVPDVAKRSGVSVQSLYK